MRPFLALVAVAGAALAQDSFEALLVRGALAFQSAKYNEAIQFLQRAADLNPTDAQTRLYLASAHMQQWNPGVTSAENFAHAAAAEVEFKRVLNADPNNQMALTSLASLAFNQSRLDEARDWSLRQAAPDPQDKGPHYMIAVIDWRKVNPALTAARERLGMRPPDPGPLSNPELRRELQAGLLPMVDEGIAQLEEALRIDPQYGDAMTYMNLLIRQRADLRDTREEYMSDIAAADAWVQKTIETRQQMQAARPTPDQVRIGTKVQEPNLILRIAPAYPDAARNAGIRGAVRINVIVDKAGRVAQMTLVSGHPLLVQAAMDAVRQWQYKPTLLNGQPIEVVAQVEVNFP